jgi:hypothetical protein
MNSPGHLVNPIEKGMVMSLLKNFPLVSQQTPISADGSSPNKNMDCVPASIGACILWYQGKTQWDQEVNPDKLLDMAYPEGYQGGTAAIKFVDACKSFGLRLSPIQSETNEGLVKEAHNYLAQNVPVIFTEVDPYMPASSGMTHVCVWYADTPTTLTAMDPWPGKPVTHTDVEWEAVMRFNEIWIMEKIQEDEIMPIDINSPEAKGFKQLDPSHWQDTSNGHIIQYGLLADYKKRGYAFLGRPWSNEITIAPGHAIQFYQFGVRQWVNGVVSSVPLYDDGPGTDPRLVAARKQIQQLQAQPQANYQAILEKIKADLAGV